MTCAKFWAAQRPPFCFSSYCDKRLLVERGDSVVEGPPRHGAWIALRPLDRAGDVLGDRRSELHELAARPFQREAVLVFASRRIRPEGGDAAAILALDGLCVP